MIFGLENLSELFSIFHDGDIARFTSSGSNLSLEVEISYLAQRVNPSYRALQIALQNAREIQFETWPNDPNAKPNVLSSLTEIFEPQLEILSGEVAGDCLKIICNQPLSKCGYSGGELLLKADSAFVTDEGGKVYSIEELRQICGGYWSDWENKNANRLPTRTLIKRS